MTRHVSPSTVDKQFLRQGSIFLASDVVHPGIRENPLALKFQLFGAP